MLKTNILARIVALRKDCIVGISNSEKMMIAEKYWVLLAIEFALYPRERKSDYPFNLPYFEVFNRLMEVSEMLKKIVMWIAWHNKVSWVVLETFYREFCIT